MCFTRSLGPLAALAILLCHVAAAPAPAAPGADAVDMELAWQRNWKNFARRVIKAGDVWYVCASYETGYPSSRGVTTVALRQKTAREVTEKFGTNVKIKKHLLRPNEDLDVMAKSIPDVLIGQYGYIHSGEILAILGPDEMVIGNLWLVDTAAVQAARDKDEARVVAAGAERRDTQTILDWLYEGRTAAAEKQADKAFKQPLKLKGFSTAGLAKGDRWRGKEADKGIAVAVVSQDLIKPTTTSTKPSTRPRPDRFVQVAVPAELFARGLSEEKEFLAYLTARGFDKAKFTALLLEERKASPTDEKLADAKIFLKLEGREEKPEDDAKKTK